MSSNKINILYHIVLLNITRFVRLKNRIVMVKRILSQVPKVLHVFTLSHNMHLESL